MGLSGNYKEKCDKCKKAKGKCKCPKKKNPKQTKGSAKPGNYGDSGSSSGGSLMRRGSMPF